MRGASFEFMIYGFEGSFNPIYAAIYSLVDRNVRPYVSLR